MYFRLPVKVVAALLFRHGFGLRGLGTWSEAVLVGDNSLAAAFLRQFNAVRLLIRDTLLQSVRRALDSRGQVRWLIAALCLGVGVRTYFLSQPMRYDEANTFLNFVDGDVARLFLYTFPNNHVFHTMLVKLSTAILGVHPATIRLPAFFAGVISIPLIYCVVRALLPNRSPLFATIALTVCPYMILYSTNARGYTLIVFFTLALLYVGTLTAATPSKAASLLLSAIAALGLLTIPSMAFAVAGVYLWLTCLFLINGNKLRQVVRDFIVPCALVTLTLTAIFYAPVILVSKGIAPLLANEYVAAQPSDLFFHRLPAHIEHTLADFSRDVPVAILLAFAALTTIGAYTAARRRDWPVLLLLPVVLAACAVLLLFKHAIPYPRTWIFVLPLVLIVANAGWNYCLEQCSQRLHGRIHVGVVFAAACYAVWLISTDAIAQYPDTGTFPDARATARYLRPMMKDGDKVRASIPTDYPLYFYLWYFDVRDFRGKAAPDAAEFFVVQRDNHEFELAIDWPVVKVVDIADAVVYQAIHDDQPGNGKNPSS